jgi:hypothetical protein
MSGRGVDALLRAAIGASAAAVALPLVLGWTRRDLAHLGFVLPASSLALASLLVALPALTRFGRRLDATRRWALVVLATAAIGCGAWFHARRVSSDFVRRPLDEHARQAFAIDKLDAWTQPGDEIFSPSAGGYVFLLSKRENATRYAALFPGYAEYQWRNAADAIVTRRPKLLRLSNTELGYLAEHRPEIKRDYVKRGAFHLRRDLVEH